MRSPLRLLLGSVLVSEGSAAAGAPEAEGTSLLLLLFLLPANNAAAATGGFGGKEAAAAGTTRTTTGNGLTASLLEAGKALTTAAAASCLVDLRSPLPAAVVVASEAVGLVSRNCNMRNMAAQHPKITLTRRVFRIMILARH